MTAKWRSPTSASKGSSSESPQAPDLTHHHQPRLPTAALTGWLRLAGQGETLASGRHLTRECLAIVVTRGCRVCEWCRNLDRLVAERGRPTAIVSDNRSELIGHATSGGPAERQPRAVLNQGLGRSIGQGRTASQAAVGGLHRERLAMQRGDGAQRSTGASRPVPLHHREHAAQMRNGLKLTSTSTF
jgi:hypothetical protein